MGTLKSTVHNRHEGSYFRIKSLVQLQAAIRCILLALRDVQAAEFAHTHIRWPNVIKVCLTVVTL